MFGTINFNYYDIDEILNYVTSELKIEITPQLKYDISHYRKPIPKKIIKKLNENYKTFRIEYFGIKEHTEKDFNKFDLIYGMYYSSIVHNGKRGL